MKHILYIIIFCLTGLFVVSCIEERPDDRVIVAPEGEAFFTMNVDMGKLPQSGIRSEEQGTLEELKIHSVRIVLYDGEDSNPGSCKVKYSFDLDIKTPDTWTNSGSIAGWLEGNDLHGQDKTGNVLRFAIEPRRVGDQKYKMLVLINGEGISPINPLKSIYTVTEVGNYLYQLNEAVDMHVDPLTGVVTNGKGIFMSNHQGLVEVTKNQLKKTDNEAIQSPIQVSVDRLVAKVTVKHAAGITFPTGIDPQTTTWGLATTNKKSFWMRKMMDNEATQSSMENLYAKDPNYDLTIDASEKPNHFNNLLYVGNGSVSLSPSSITNKMEDYEYLLENTIPAENINDTKACLDQITHIVVGYKYTPNGYSASDSYYIFNNQIITVGDMNTYQGGGNIPAALTGLNTAIGQTDKTKYPLDGSGTSYFETNGIRFCPQGQIYYYFPIRHFNKAEGSLGYYGVVRNNIYEITIKSLKVPESTNGYLSADISIQPWTMRGQKNTVGALVSEKKWVTVKLYHHLHYGGENLYKLLTKQYGQELEYQTILARADYQITSYNLNLEEKFKKDLLDPSYRNLKYMFSVPEKGILVSEDISKNVLDLIYSASYAYVIMFNQVNVCFIKDDGTILNVTGNGITNNPHIYDMSFVKPTGIDDGRYVFFKHFPDLYKLRITDSANVEYEITSQDACAMHYVLKAGTTGGKVSLVGTQPMKEPVKMANTTGTMIPDRGLAIICTPK